MSGTAKTNKRHKLNPVDRVISYFDPGRGLRRLENRMRLELASGYFRGATSDRLRKDWVVSGFRNTTPPAWELQTLRDRSRDLNRNDPVASGATETMGINIVGQGLRPQSQIRSQNLGISEERARELQRQAEMAWQKWIPFADSANRLDFSEIQFLALRKIVEDGEIIAIPTWASESWRPFGRCIELIEADRLASRGYDNSGIELGPRGEPKKYHLYKQSFEGAQRLTSQETVEILPFDQYGRPKIIHLFPAKRPGQLRGVPFFAPVLTYFKDMADYLEAEVVAARVSACLAVFITSDNPYQTATANANDTETTSLSKLQTLEPGMIYHAKTGQGVGVVDPKRPGNSFQPFIEALLRMIGASLNLPYEILFKDFSKTNYSSARAALLEARRMFMTWRGWFSRKFCQVIWEMILEEAFLRDQFDATDFYTLKSEYCRAKWIGGGWGWVDPVKEVESSRMAIDYGLSTLAEEVAGQGGDWEETAEQLAREKSRLAELGLELDSAGKQTGPKQTATTGKEDPDESA